MTKNNGPELYPSLQGDAQNPGRLEREGPIPFSTADKPGENTRYSPSFRKGAGPSLPRYICSLRQTLTELGEKIKGDVK